MLKSCGQQNAEVLATDIDESRGFRQIAALCNHAIVAGNATDEATVAELGPANFDIVFVAIGDNLRDQHSHHAGAEAQRE